MKTEVQSVIVDLIAKAREIKRRSRQRLLDLRGDSILTPSRGPLLSNGRRCFRWHFWRASIENHKKATAKVSAVIKATGIKPDGYR